MSIRPSIDLLLTVALLASGCSEVTHTPSSPFQTPPGEETPKNEAPPQSEPKVEEEALIEDLNADLLALDDLSAKPCIASDGQCMTEFAITDSNQTPVHTSFSLDAPSSRIERALIVIHGEKRKPENMFTLASQAAIMHEKLETTQIVAPLFSSSKDAATENQTTWTEGDWYQGDTSDGLQTGSKIPSFAVVDLIIEKLSDRKAYPNLSTITIAGAYQGARFVILYAATNRSEDHVSPIKVNYVAIHSPTYLYLDGKRPTGGLETNESPRFKKPFTLCATNRYPYGLNGRNQYSSDMQKKLLRDMFLARDVTYLLPETSVLDPSFEQDDSDKSCAAKWQGASRFERARNFQAYLERYYPEAKHQFVFVPGTDSSPHALARSPEGLEALFR